MPFFAAPARKIVALLGHLLGLLLAHRAAQQVGAAERVAAQHLRDLHHLLLVDHDRRRSRRASAPAADAGTRPRSRPCLRSMKSGIRSIGPGRNSATSAMRSSKRSGCASLQHVAACRAIRTGTPRSVLPSREQLVGRARRRAAAFSSAKSSLLRMARDDEVLGPVEDRQRGQAEEVELHQADGLDVVLVELGDRAESLPGCW